MRAFIRISIDGETNGKFALALRKVLEMHGFVLTPASATYECNFISMQGLASAMTDFWETAANPTKVAGVGAGVRLDHSWFYTDGL